MKRTIISLAVIIILGPAIIITSNRCSGTKESAGNANNEVIRTNVNGTGMSVEVEFRKGTSYNHPLIAIWVEDQDGKYIETLYVSQSIGKGVFAHGDKSTGDWQPGPIRRPAALPYWGHKRGVQAPDGLYIPTPDSPMPDAVTGPTPSGDFTLQSRVPSTIPAKYKILLEINQSWDWNEYWTNNKYPGDDNYKTSSQPSLVYEALIDQNSTMKEYLMKPVGHGHYSGLDGSLDPDLSTLTTALDISKNIKVKIDNN